MGAFPARPAEKAPAVESVLLTPLVVLGFAFLSVPGAPRIDSLCP
jgi:hypothetical protein